MATSARVQRVRDDLLRFEHDPRGDAYVVAGYRGGYAVYEDATGYSSTSGQTLGKGAVQRDVEDRVVRFVDPDVAAAWIRAGLPLVDHRGDPLDFKKWMPS